MEGAVNRTGSNVAASTDQIQVTATAFFALFSIVGLALYGLPLYYDFMVREFGWSRTMVTSGNAINNEICAFERANYLPWRSRG